MTLISKVKVKYTKKLFMVILIFRPLMFKIFCLIIVYVVWITMKIIGHRYDLGVKNKGQKYI